jgi:hypothetical protein
MTIPELETLAVVALIAKALALIPDAVAVMLPVFATSAVLVLIPAAKEEVPVVRVAVATAEIVPELTTFA